MFLEFVFQFGGVGLGGGEFFLRGADVGRFLHRARRTACGGPGTGNVTELRAAFAEEGTEEGAAHADRGLHLRRTGLRLLLGHCFLSAGHFLRGGTRLGRIFLTQTAHSGIAFLASGLLEAQTEFVFVLEGRPGDLSGLLHADFEIFPEVLPRFQLP